MFIALAVFVALMFVTAPYGRHATRKWGLTVPDRTGWMLMEFPALLIFLYFVLTGDNKMNLTVGIITLLYAAHYVNRSLVFPFRIRTKGKEMPLAIALMAVLFNTVNASMLGYYTGTLQTFYDSNWLSDPRFIAGIIIFLTGMIINMTSDNKLIQLRKSNGNGYQIPYGGLFEYVSCPNFLGEIIEWAGYALLCWSLPSLSFLVWTLCNLIPRALDHQKWYESHFPEYPEKRKAIFPFIV